MNQATAPEQPYRYVRYVPHRLVAEFEAKGWVVSDDLLGTHHGQYSKLMEWKGEGEPGWDCSSGWRPCDDR